MLKNTVSSKDTQISTKDADIQKLNTMVGDRDAEIETMSDEFNTMIDDKDGKIQDLEQQISDEEETNNEHEENIRELIRLANVFGGARATNVEEAKTKLKEYKVFQTKLLESNQKNVNLANSKIYEINTKYKPQINQKDAELQNLRVSIRELTRLVNKFKG